MDRHKKKSERKKERKGKEEKRIGKKQEHSFLLPLGFISYTAKFRDGEIDEGRNQGKFLVLFSLIGCQEMHQCCSYQRDHLSSFCVPVKTDFSLSDIL